MTALGNTEPVVDVPSDSLAAAVLRAEGTAVRLRQVEFLRVAAQTLLDEAAKVGCSELVPASQAAEPLVTAAALLSDGSVTIGDRLHSMSEKVVLVDAATVTGSVARECATYLRERGATWVAVLIYDRVRPDLDSFDGDPIFDLVAELDKSC